MKILKCYCNDEHMCPLKNFKEQQIETESTDFIRHCQTNTVCLTKRLKRSNGTTWLKYFCDHSSLNSLRGRVIQYRDCKINSTSNLNEKHIVEQSHEYCCDSYDYCNKDLKPINYVRDFEEIEINNDVNNMDYHMSKSFYLNDNPHLHVSLFTSINIILLSSLLVFLLLTILFIFAYFVKYYKQVLKFKTKNKSNKLIIHKEYPYNLKNFNYPSSVTTTSSSAYTTSTSATTDTTLKTTENSFNSYDWSHNLVNVVNGNAIVPLNIKPTSTSRATTTSILSYQFNHSNNYPYVNYSYSSTNSPSIAKSDKSTYSSCVLTSSSAVSTTNSPIDAKDTLKNKSHFPLDYSYPINTNEKQIIDCINGLNEWSGSGSGAGVPELLQRTIARQIKLVYPCIGKGRFGEVYKGIWRDELVAVKTFNSADEKSWQNECAIYNTSGFRHENILGFIAADNIDRGTYTELWIITEYHKNGSLFDYLNSNTITISDLFKMSISIVNGLDHLHTPIESCTGKPALAHCDLKSKNILVKSDLTCCIGDLGLALSGDKSGNIVYQHITNNNFSNNRPIVRTGTKRYMAPEILSNTINIQSLVEFQNAEIYSLALIFWELLRRTRIELNSKVLTNDYQLPYYEYLYTQDPDLEKMNEIVCIQKKRPELVALWRELPMLNEYTQILEELWNENAHARLNALRLKKSLNSIFKRVIQIINVI